MIEPDYQAMLDGHEQALAKWAQAEAKLARIAAVVVPYSIPPEMPDEGVTDVHRLAALVLAILKGNT